VRRKSPFARSRAKRREMPVVELSLAAMVDMMINILIFLLHLYGRGAMVEPQSDDMELADSTTEEPLQLTVGVVVTRRAVEVGGQVIVDLEELQLRPGELSDGAIPALTEALTSELARERAKAKPGEATEAQLLVQTDKRVPWSVLGPVLRSGAAAGAASYRFVVSINPEAQ
jgi:biopolymer transport protein ExbD